MATNINSGIPTEDLGSVQTETETFLAELMEFLREEHIETRRLKFSEGWFEDDCYFRVARSGLTVKTREEQLKVFEWAVSRGCKESLGEIKASAMEPQISYGSGVDLGYPIAFANLDYESDGGCEIDYRGIPQLLDYYTDDAAEFIIADVEGEAA